MRGCLKVVLYRLDCKACPLRQPDSQDAMSNGWHHSAHGAMSEIGGPGVFRGWTAFRHHSALVEVLCCYCTQPPGRLGLPPTPRNKLNRFQCTVASHIKSCTAHWGGGGWRQKARLFVTERKGQRKPIFNKQGIYAWLWSGHLSILHTMPVSIYLRKPWRDMWCQYQIIWIIWWTQNRILHSGALVLPQHKPGSPCATGRYLQLCSFTFPALHDLYPGSCAKVMILTQQWAK